VAQDMPLNHCAKGQLVKFFSGQMLFLLGYISYVILNRSMQSPCHKRHVILVFSWVKCGACSLERTKGVAKAGGGERTPSQSQCCLALLSINNEQF